jgi:hypothetical protein
MNRVFILGAGFSKSAGMPLATELTSCIVDGTDLKDYDEMQVWLADFKQRLETAEGADGHSSHFPLNIEQVFDFAKYDEELWRMRQQLAPVGRTYGDTPWDKAESISGWLDDLERKLAHVIWSRQKQASLESIRRFTDQLSEKDTVLTFNYDTLVETALCARKQPWNHGLDDRDRGGVTVLKLHGSVDWILLERRPKRNLENFTRLFSKRDSNVEDHGYEVPQEEEYALELWRVEDANTLSALLDRYESGLGDLRYMFGLAGLGAHKPLHKLVGSAQAWAGAFIALREAEEMYVIGFSMSPYDSMTRFHFTSIIRARENRPERVVVIDPNAVELTEAFRRVFGNTITLNVARAQDVEWDKLLA